MTHEEHRERHELLHKMLDELLADWASHTRVLFSQATAMDLLTWSHAQTIFPVHGEHAAVQGHIYLSTACSHEQHAACRQACKFCQAPCRCECHRTASTNIPEDPK